ncbi:cytochrome P450 [Xylariaceae sp. FL0804]|nr:cytochrome P450 [Xylariaceae sp. FL0804]
MEPIQYILSWAAYLPAAVATYLLLLFGYRLTLHPLSKYPGPFLARLSDAYAGYYAGRMSLHIRTREDHMKYGPIMRHGPNKLVFNSTRAMRDIFLNDRVAKPVFYENMAVTPGVWDTFSVTDKSIHRVKRKLISQAISERSMRIFEPTMMDQIDIFLSILHSSSGAPVNMTDRLKRLGMDIVGLLAFGSALNTQTDPKNRFLISAHVFGGHRSNLFIQFPLLKATRIYNILESLATADVRRYFDTINNIIAARVAEDKHVRHDLYSLVSDHMDTSGGVRSEMWAEALFFFPAGGETTATLLCATFFYLSRNRRVYEKLANEIRAAFQFGDEIRSGPRLAGCQYLRACLDESLRMSPPGAGTAWRELPASDGSPEPLVVDGHVIPPGVQVGMNIYALHHNEEYFPDSFSYLPERWLDRNQTTQEAFMPFGLGARSCAGKAMANHEATLVLAKTMWHFDFHSAPGKPGQVGGGSPKLGTGRNREGEFQLYEIIAATHDGPNLVFAPREVPSKTFVNDHVVT